MSNNSESEDEEDIIAKCDDFRIEGMKGSTAEKYAKDNSIVFLAHSLE